MHEKPPIPVPVLNFFHLAKSKRALTTQSQQKKNPKTKNTKNNHSFFWYLYLGFVNERAMKSEDFLSFRERSGIDVRSGIGIVVYVHIWLGRRRVSGQTFSARHFDRCDENLGVLCVRVKESRIFGLRSLFLAFFFSFSFFFPVSLFK